MTTLACNTQGMAYKVSVIEMLMGLSNLGKVFKS